MGLSDVRDREYQVLWPLGDWLDDLGDLSAIKTLTPPDDCYRVVLQAELAAVRIVFKNENSTADPTSSHGIILDPSVGSQMFAFAAGCTLDIIEVAAGAKVQYQWHA